MFIMCIRYYQADPYYSNMMYNPLDVRWRMLNHIMSQYYLHYLGIFKLKGLEFGKIHDDILFWVVHWLQRSNLHNEGSVGRFVERE